MLFNVRSTATGRRGAIEAARVLILALLATACAGSPALPPTAAPLQTQAATLAQPSPRPSVAPVTATTASATASPLPATHAPQPTAAVPAPTPTPPPAVPNVGQVDATFMVPEQVGGMRFGAGSLWFGTEDGQVLRLDPVTHAVIAILPVRALDLQVSGDTVWVIEDGTRSVARIDVMTNAIAEEIPTGITQNLGPTALDGDNLWLVVGNGEAQRIVKLDTKTKKVVAESTASGELWGLTAGAGSLWASDEKGVQVLRFDAQTAKLIAKIPVSIGPADITFALGSIWTANRDGTVSRIDPATNKVIANITVGGTLYSLAVGAGIVWAAGRGDTCETDGQVARIDPKTNTVVGVMQLPCAQSVLAAQGRLWAADNKHQQQRAGAVWEIIPAAAAGGHRR